MNEQQLQEIDSLVEKQRKQPMYYRRAVNWMWDYCVCLGKYVDKEGRKCDLGIHIARRDRPRIYSDATVWSNKPGDYSSGDLVEDKIEYHDEKNRTDETRFYIDSRNERIREIKRRFNELRSKESLLPECK